MINFNTKHLLLILFHAALFKANGQVTLYNADFNSGFQGWTTVLLTSPWNNQPDLLGYYNVWYTGDGESGMPPNTCGTYGAGNPTLHMGWQGNPGGGAAYHSGAQTNRRIQSPNISTVGYSNLVLQFDFIGNGCQTRDLAYLQYSTNGGTSWTNATGAPTTANPALPSGSNLNNLKSQICASSQGRWTRITWNMPAACNNIPNLRIAIVWQNSNNSSCSSSPADPSFAIDNVLITAPAPVPVELIFFETNLNDNFVELRWATASETNNNYFSIERSTDGLYFETIANIAGAGNSNEPLFYSFQDLNLPKVPILYYRLKQTDFDGSYSYSQIRSVYLSPPRNVLIYPTQVNDVIFIELTNYQYQNIHVEFVSILGQIVFSSSFYIEQQFSNIAIPIQHLPPGGYLLKLTDKHEIHFWKIVRKNN